MTVVKAAAVQLSPVLYRRDGTLVIADLDFSLIDQRKAKMDASGHYSRPELLSLLVDRSQTAHVHERAETQAPALDAEADHVLL